MLEAGLAAPSGCNKQTTSLIAVDDPDTNIKATRLIRRMYPDARVLARARNRQHAWRLMDMGVEPFREVFGSSLEMGEKVLVELGLPPDVAAAHTRRFREHDEELLRRQYLIYDDEAALVQTAQDSRQDLMKLFEADLTESPRAGTRKPAGPGPA